MTKLKFEIGDRVISSEVSPRDYNSVKQEKHLEIIQIANSIASCKYFLENETNPKIDYINVNISSLKFISKSPLKYKGSSEDDFFNKNK